MQAQLEVLREGKAFTVEARLVKAHRLVPVHISNKPPTYYIIAGLVFTQARMQFQIARLPRPASSSVHHIAADQAACWSHAGCG